MTSVLTLGQSELEGRHDVLNVQRDGCFTYTFGMVKSYEAKYGDRFCVVIRTELTSNEAYIMPFPLVRRLLIEDLLMGLGWEGLRVIERSKKILDKISDIPTLYQRLKAWPRLLRPDSEPTAVAEVLDRASIGALLDDLKWWGEIREGRIYAGANRKPRGQSRSVAVSECFNASQLLGQVERGEYVHVVHALKPSASNQPQPCPEEQSVVIAPTEHQVVCPTCSRRASVLWAGRSEDTCVPLCKVCFYERKRVPGFPPPSCKAHTFPFSDSPRRISGR